LKEITGFDATSDRVASDLCFSVFSVFYLSLLFYLVSIEIIFS